jgi:hypothetical protein
MWTNLGTYENKRERLYPVLKEFKGIGIPKEFKVNSARERSGFLYCFVHKRELAQNCTISLISSEINEMLY